MLIILALSFSFTTIQFDDTNYRAQAEPFYFNAKLDEIEFPLYLAMTKQTTKLDNHAIYLLLKQDLDFQKVLVSDSLLSEEDLNYWRWIKKRRDYNYLLSKDCVDYFGFKTAAPKWQTVIPSLFLSPLSLTPLVGAAGAMSGFVGLFSSYYGRQWMPCLFLPNLKIFKIPGIVALLLWGGWFAINTSFLENQGDSNEVLLGGLMAGLLVGFGLKGIQILKLKRHKIKSKNSFIYDYEK